MNESAIGDKMKSALEKLSGKENKSLIELLMPYRHLLKPYYEKYYVNGAIQPELIEADIRRFNFTARANEGWESIVDSRDYADNQSNPVLLRILYKVFVRFPKGIVSALAEWFGDMFRHFREGETYSGLVSATITAVAAVLIYILCIGAYQCGDYIFNGLDNGVAMGGAEFEPAHYETHTHHVGGKHPHTYTTRDYVPDRWHVEVRGLDKEENRTEKWATYNREVGDAVWKGDTLTNNEDWTWEVTEEF